MKELDQNADPLQVPDQDQKSIQDWARFRARSLHADRESDPIQDLDLDSHQILILRTVFILIILRM